MITADNSVAEPAPVPEGSLPAPEPEPVLDDAQLVSSAARALQELFAREPSARQEFGQILREHLQPPLTADSAQTLFTSMSILAGEETANLLLGVLKRSFDDKAFLAQLEGALDDKSRSWMRVILARYGPRLKEAWIIGGESPEAWRSVNRAVSYDLVSGWQITFELIKYSGERLKVQDTPSNFLFMVSAILDTLSLIPEDQAPNLLDADGLSEFVGKAGAFIRLFAPDTLEQADDATGGDTDTVAQPQP